MSDHRRLDDCVPPQPVELPSVARSRHMRRELERAASHGVALLAALGLPRLVDDDFAPLDGNAIGDALDLVVAHLDAIDAPTDDLEDDGTAEDDDPSEDDGTPEPILGAPEEHPFVPMFHHYYRAKGDGGQLCWGRGRNDALNDGEAEPGYDLAEGDDERCGSDDVDADSSIGWPEDFTADVNLAVYAGDAEFDPVDCLSLPVEAFRANERAEREAERQARAIRQRAIRVDPRLRLGMERSARTCITQNRSRSVKRFRPKRDKLCPLRAAP